MAASCYLCDVRAASISGRAAGDALGTCRLCHVLACTAHAVRDPNYPRWICVLCDSTLLTAAAGLHSTSSSVTTVASLVSSALTREAARYPTLTDFLTQRPDMAWVGEAVPELLDRIPQRLRPGSAVAQLWSNLDAEGQRLFAAAFAIAIRLDVAPAFFIEPLRMLIEGWRHGG